jgi:hypothetical protein
MLLCVVLIACLGGSVARGDAGSRVRGCPSSEVESESTSLVWLNNIHSATTIRCTMSSMQTYVTRHTAP